MSPTQCERVLSMLRVAGKRGVRSDEFFKVGLPRGVARIYDLRQRGVEIEDEPEGKYKRFRLVGSSAGARGDGYGASVERSRAEVFPRSTSAPPVSVASGEDSSGGLGPASGSSGEPPAELHPSPPARPLMFDYDADWAA